ncbi:hypothetical protein NCS57_00847300 [Fusarium keratoplasticum]|uniref:Uncharacterized protein n=1 Tax=Fusarium keratoplasticum TaxID=1328300 RepID=A0ACC0QUS5_9HYPO|nr:hypothetical protein NCS57_00847300 [Fusarium keratoplasticum]KAI8666230.1 hypothetical protein NCS57_00847300 [Fusarium keratoplasticum]
MSESRKSKSPLRALDPQPMRSPSPPDGRAPERAKSYPGPDSQSQQYGPQPYNPQDYSNQSYNPQNYGPPPNNYGSQNYNQSYNPQNYPPVSGPQTGPAMFPTRPVSDSYLPDQGGAMASSTKITTTQQYSTQQQYSSQQQMVPAIAPTSLRELQALKTTCQFSLREYVSLQRQRRSGDSAMSAYELDTRIRNHTNVMLSDLRILQSEVRGIGKEAENHRWRRWIIGGAIATFIPFIRKFWRRSHDDEESAMSANDTEYAFRKSKGLLEYIKNALLGHGRWAKFAFIVFAVLFVFSNEVSLRVARTVQKRIKKLCVRIEQGDPDVDEKDMKVLDGWRWRVLLW